MPDNLKDAKPINKAAEAPLAEMNSQVWNTKNLGLRAASDAFSGFFAATLVAPIILSVDKSVLPNLFLKLVLTQWQRNHAKRVWTSQPRLLR